MDLIISDADIESITGYKSPKKQCQKLKEAGIFFVPRRDGRPRTTWEHFNNPAGKTLNSALYDEEPNFEGL